MGTACQKITVSDQVQEFLLKQPRSISRYIIKEVRNSDNLIRNSERFSEVYGVGIGSYALYFEAIIEYDSENLEYNIIAIHLLYIENLAQKFESRRRVHSNLSWHAAPVKGGGGGGSGGGFSGGLGGDGASVTNFMGRPRRTYHAPFTKQAFRTRPSGCALVAPGAASRGTCVPPIAANTRRVIEGSFLP